MKPGTRVEVRSRYDARWSHGFEIAEIVERDASVGFRIRRRSDGAVLPVVFDGDDLREDRRRKMWWQ